MEEWGRWPSPLHSPHLHADALLHRVRKILDYSFYINCDKNLCFWRPVVWSNETEIEVFGHNDHSYIWRKKWQASFVLYMGGRIMTKSCVARQKIGIMKKEHYMETVKQRLKISARRLKLHFCAERKRCVSARLSCKPDSVHQFSWRYGQKNSANEKLVEEHLNIWSKSWEI